MTSKPSIDMREPSHIVTVHESDSPPDGGYGWVVTAAIALVNFHSWGINSAYSVFLAYYIKNGTFHGATSLHYALVGGLSVGCSLATAPCATTLVHKFGPKPVMLCGSVVQSAGLVASGFCTGIWHLFLSQGVLFGLGMGFLFQPLYGLISQWFEKRRATANGIAIAGAGLGGMIYSISAGVMLARLSLQWAYYILALICFVINTASALLIRTRDHKAKARQVTFEIGLLRNPEYLLLLLFSILSMLAYFILMFTLANYGVEMGFSESRASLLPAMLNLGQALGRPVMGYVGDRIGCITATALFTYLTGFWTLVVWINAKSYAVMMFFSLTEGLVLGVFWVMISPLLATTIEPQSLPAGLTILWLSLVLPCTFSSAIALAIREQTGSYLGAQLFAGITFLAAGSCAHILRGWKLQRLSSVQHASTKDDCDGQRKIFHYQHFLRACFKWGLA
ncbi:putative transporter MCH2 [Paramyrothecium foliicola]|nr:putative transporter MCH2 [Paramyrothecium foliicola]